MLISLDIYSGRPNPTWVLSAKDADSLVQRVEGRAVAEASEVEGVLGFRGFVVSAMGDEALPADLPASFRVASLLPADAAMGDATAKPLSADESDEAMLWLMSSGRHVVDDELQAYVADALQTRFLDEGPAEPAAEEDEAVEALACVIANTAYNPAFWNQAAVQPRNNCYRPPRNTSKLL